MNSLDNTRVVVAIEETPPGFSDEHARRLEHYLGAMASYMVAEFPPGLDDSLALDVFERRFLHIETALAGFRRAGDLGACGKLLLQQAACFLALADRCINPQPAEDAHG